MEIRCRATAHWEREHVIQSLSGKLSEYDEQKDQHEISGLFKMQVDSEPEILDHANPWIGRKLFDSTKNRIGIFHRDKFLYSQLQPYSRWEDFLEESLRLWKIHCEIAQPGEVQRIGIRFINRIQINGNKIELEEYISTSPKSPMDMDMPTTGFLYQDIYGVPDSTYGITITRTAEPLTEPASSGINLIIDIDAYSDEVITPAEDKLTKILNDLRYLKNKAFFGTITEKTRGILS